MKCKRTACEYEVGLSYGKHKYTESKYCLLCVKKINEACGEDVVAVIKHPKEDLIHSAIKGSYYPDCDHNFIVNERSEHVTRDLSRVNCHDCLAILVTWGDQAAARIIELDTAAGKTKSTISEAAAQLMFDGD